MTLRTSRGRDRHTYAVLRYGKSTATMEFGALHGAIYIPLAKGQKAVRMWKATANDR